MKSEERKDLLISEGITEDGIEVGNHYDKYNSKNPIVQRIMSGFHDSLESMVSLTHPTSIHEVGCGEGFWVIQWSLSGIQTKGTDFSSKVIQIAKTNSEKAGVLQNLVLEAKSIYDLKTEDSADLIVCCEVLEHLEDPDLGLSKLRDITQNHIILSVPREPIWKLLNMARGKYWSDFGNTPGHIQAWSKREFTNLIKKYFTVLEVKTPLPWTMILAKKK